MTSRTTSWRSGLPCWADLTSPDIAAAQAFYGALLGWQFSDTGSDEYVIASVGERAAAGIGPMTPEAPSAWTLYFATEDVEKTQAQITEAGGTVLLPAVDVGVSGRMLIAADPTGAVFGAWQAGEHIGAQVVNEPGALMWEDLRTSDPDAARSFYHALFGFTYDDVPMAGDAYKTFALPSEDVPAGGIGDMMGMTDAPPHWLVYFAVADEREAVATAKENGATVIFEHEETPYGTMAGIVDPFGASFVIIEPPEGAPQPNRED